MTEITVNDFMDKLKKSDKSHYNTIMTHIMSEFGTSLHCNRFAIGNSNEYAIADVVRSTGLKVTEMQNASRVDQSVENFGEFSIKYSTTGDIKLHNSNNTSNTDTNMHDTLLVTPDEWWFLRPSEMALVGIDFKNYIKNTGDGLSLQRTILSALKRAGYTHFFPFNVSVDKKKCKNRETSRVFFDAIKAQLGLP